MAKSNKCKLFFISIAVLLSCSLFLTAGVKEVKDPNPTRFKKDIDAFMKWDSKNSPAENAVLFVGSSSIVMWETNEAFGEYPVINRGFGGSHISDVIYYYDKVIQGYDPALIVFYAGDNDAASGKAAEQILEDYKYLLSRIRKDYPEVPFIYLPIKPTSSRWKYWDEMKKTNRLIREFNKQKENLYYVDTATALLTPKGLPNDELFLKDKLHMNEKGYNLWNEILRVHLKSLYENGCGGNKAKK
jgi:lysophospholipase L1-like esterase